MCSAAGIVSWVFPSKGCPNCGNTSNGLLYEPKNESKRSDDVYEDYPGTTDLENVPRWSTVNWRKTVAGMNEDFAQNFDINGAGIFNSVLTNLDLLGIRENSLPLHGTDSLKTNTIRTAIVELGPEDLIEDVE